MQTAPPPLSVEDTARLRALGERRTLSAGESLISHGQPPPGLFLVRSGRVAVHVEEQGHRVFVGHLGPEACVGEMSLLSGAPTTADVICDAPCVVDQVSKERLDAALTADPTFAARLHRWLGELIAWRLTRGARHAQESSDTVAHLVGRADALWADAIRTSWGNALSGVHRIRFTQLVADCVERYEAVADRDAFLWRWAVRGLELTQLSLVPSEHEAHVADTKLLAVILNVLLDDLADERASERLLEAALGMLHAPVVAPLPAVPEEDRAYFQLIRDLWATIRARCASLLGWSTYRRLLDFDYRQVFSAMRYGLLLHHQPELLNVSEHELYPPHNMNMMVFGTLDLMASHTLPKGELGPLREVLWRAQSMGQISNMLVTWEREIPDRDFSSRIFAIAMSDGVFAPGDLHRLDPEAIATRVREAGIEARLLRQWRLLEEELRELGRKVPSVDVERYLEGLHALLGMTLASRRLI